MYLPSQHKQVLIEYTLILLLVGMMALYLLALFPYLEGIET